MAHVLSPPTYADGPQHDEVKSGLGLLTKLLGWSWPKEDRALPVHNAIMHRSVYERFDLKAVQVYYYGHLVSAVHTGPARRFRTILCRKSLPSRFTGMSNGKSVELP